MSTVPVWSRDQGQYIRYCVVNELASLLWAVNIGSIELHSSLHLGQERLGLRKVGGQWRITSESNLKTYFKNGPNPQS